MLKKKKILRLMIGFDRFEIIMKELNLGKIFPNGTFQQNKTKNAQFLGTTLGREDAERENNPQQITEEKAQHLTLTD